MSYRIGFVLSTGRTGTVFIAKKLSQLFPDILTVHEPGMSRYQYLLGNFSRQWPIVTPFLHRWFWFSRPEIHNNREGYPQGYIEINPFLSSFSDVLSELEVPLRIVHVVRHPYTWISSMSDFKASGYRKTFINYLPYNQPVPPGETARNHLERLAWRWRLYNENIVRLKQEATSFSQVKFEELFGDDTANAAKAFQEILKTFELEDIVHGRFDERTKENANPNPKGTISLNDRIAPQELERIRNIVSPIAEQLGYEL
ncbi:MAG: hypothetical protein O7C75_14015 [Verrucomicrobia bacterium]|nr:hypothetical protein [Verrucomicrobiota bacterium]